MLVLFRPNGITSFTRTAYPDLMPFQITTTRLSWKRGCCILPGYAPFFYSSCMGFKYGSHLSSFHCSQYFTSYDSR